VREYAHNWVADHPDELALIRRVFAAADDRRIPSQVRPEDKAALAAWVEDRVLNSPLPLPVGWQDWPPRFVHRKPHRDLADFEPI
jgi:hypothetical protein